MAPCPFPPQSYLRLGSHVRQERHSQVDHDVSYYEKQTNKQTGFPMSLISPIISGNPCQPSWVLGSVSSTCESITSGAPNCYVSAAQCSCHVGSPGRGSREYKGRRHTFFMVLCLSWGRHGIEKRAPYCPANPQWKDPQTGQGRGRPSLGFPQALNSRKDTVPATEAKGQVSLSCYTYCFAKFHLLASERGKIGLQLHFLYRQESL